MQLTGDSAAPQLKTPRLQDLLNAVGFISFLLEFYVTRIWREIFIVVFGQSDYTRVVWMKEYWVGWIMREQHLEIVVVGGLNSVKCLF